MKDRIYNLSLKLLWSVLCMIFCLLNALFFWVIYIKYANITDSMMFLCHAIVYTIFTIIWTFMLFSTIHAGIYFDKNPNSEMEIDDVIFNVIFFEKSEDDFIKV